jgi:hypothetical protein
LKIGEGSMTDSTNSRVLAGVARLRRGVLWVIFGVVLLIPKLNGLRRRRRAWNFVRIILGTAGAALFALGEARGHGFGLLLAGTALLVIALVVGAEHSGLSVDARAKELGALIVVEGGGYMDEARKTHRVRLFVGPDRLCALDADLHVLLEIPMQQIRNLAAAASGGGWSVRVEWEQGKTEFMYEGTFAEHLARVAEATVRSCLHRELPVLR